ncbi:MAG TPA: PD-(D/E)XK nuclease family protein, partial [Acidimicrobiales bacterium]|nr:PD-(D/E)XK nuclease family protein [Acidimicrobiales bacterium]
DGRPLAPVTVVTATGFAAVASRRALARAGGGRGVANVTCTTVDGLVRALGAPVLAERGLRPVPAAVDAEVIGAEVAASRGRLAAVGANPRTVEALRHTLAELRRCDHDAVTALGRHPGRAGELAQLLLAVRARLHAHGFADGHDLVTAALEAARGPVGGALGTVVRAELPSLAPLEENLLAALGAPVQAAATAPRPAPACTEVVDCSDPDEEVRAVVHLLLQDIERGVPLWDQAVAYPVGTAYGRIVHQQLADAGVAACGPEPRRLDRSMTGHCLVGLLELADGTWPREELAAWWSCAPVTDGPAGRPVPATRWDALSAEAGVVAGVGQWRDRVGRLAARGGNDGDEAASMARFVEDLVARGAAPAARSWSAHSSWALSLLDHYLAQGAGEGTWDAAERAAATQVRGVVAALGDLDALAGGTDLAGFRRAVRAELERSPLDTGDLGEGGVGDGVFVGTLRDLRGMNVDTTAVVGLADALVPGLPVDDALLPDEVCAEDGSGALRTRAARRAELHDALSAALATGSARRVALWPRTDPRTGRAQAPSRWLAGFADGGSRRTVTSFAATVASQQPATSVTDLALRTLARAAVAGTDPVDSPVVGGEARLAVGLEAVRSRAGSPFTRFDGAVGEGLVTPFDAAAPVSATRFETYAACPRRYLLGRVLEVERRTRPEELWAIEPIERGSLLHGVLEEYVLERINGAARSQERLLAIAEARFDEAEAAGIVGKPLLWRLEKTAMRRDLRTLFAEEGELEPLAAELPFGLDVPGAGPAVEVPVRGGRTVRFRGSADRVDRASDGRLVVSDYKTGRQGSLAKLAKDPCAGGTRLQLPLYAMAARARFGGDGTVVARYWLVSGERRAPRYAVALSEAVEARFRHVVGTIADGVVAGAFPGVPGARSYRSFEACAYCDFDAICPTTREREWSRKRGARSVAPVVDLREREVPDDVAGAVTTDLLPDEGRADR